MVLRSKPRNLRLAALALPFLVTAGCSSTPKPQPEAPRPWRDEAGTCWVMPHIDCPPPEEATCNPPPPQTVDCPADPAQLSHDAFQPPAPTRNIGRDADGSCWEMVDVDCPPPEEGTCNPPPPRKVVCPDDPQTLNYDHYKPVPHPSQKIPRNPPSPRPFPVTPVAPPAVRRDADGSCWTVPDTTCPPGVESCRLAPEQSVPCPADVKTLQTDDYKPLPPLREGRIVRHPNGGCYEYINVTCPPSVNGIRPTCNPPPPRPVPCPADLEE